MDEKKNELNEQNLERVAGGSGGVAYICTNCGALVWESYNPASAPQVTMIHCPECGRLCDGCRR